MSSSVNFTLCDYFNAKGQQIERIFISTETDDVAAAVLQSGVNIEADVRRMRAEAKAAGQTTNLEDAALALTALIGEVVRENISIHDAREVLSISVNFGKPVTIPDIMPALEIRHGANTASWARGIFPHLGLGHPGIQ